jgi:hypothetical protein
MIKILVTNPELHEEERTFLTSDYSTGTNLYVANNEGFTASWFAITGEPGQEKTESKQISSIASSTTIVVPAQLNFSHSKSTSIYLSQWDKIALERKATGGSFTATTDSPFSIEWDNENNETLLVVSDGSTTDSFRWRFYNSVLDTYSDYSDTLLGTGTTRYTAGYVLQQVKKNPIAQEVDDETILDYMNDYQSDVVYPEIPKAWWFTKEGTPLATTASDYTYSISDNWNDLSAIKYVLFRYISGSTDITYPLTFSPSAEFYNLKSDSNQAKDDNVKYWSLLPPDASSDKGYIGLHTTPKTAVCYIKPVYFFELTDLNSFGDALPVPHPKGYVDYCLYRIAEDIKNDSSAADRYNSRVKNSIIYLKRLNRRQLGQSDLFRFRGARGYSRMFGEGGTTNSPESRELYW